MLAFNLLSHEKIIKISLSFWIFLATFRCLFCLSSKENLILYADWFIIQDFYVYLYHNNINP